ncbi:MAG: hypothetical protein JWQ27_520 [Ferruginibacter sp.]|nr:hypothetical protein [Ferruginibacter sp.]
MRNQPQVIISPSELPVNSSLTVRSTDEPFADAGYMITDEVGRVVRKGAICRGISEFKLSMVGLATGAYRFTMGAVQEKFVILS